MDNVQDGPIDSREKAMEEVGWVARRALELASAGLPQEHEEWAEFYRRKAALLAFIEEQRIADTVAPYDYLTDPRTWGKGAAE